MSDDSTATPKGRLSDRDLARLVRIAREELAEDPSAAEIHERIADREEAFEDRRYRAHSEKGAVLGWIVGVALLMVVAISIIIDH
ncbi:hypothetical protein OG322_26170 [Streptomyces sp. NBC_01260]|uniref:hypothetical protein n=1 Tax=Streptomyces sp. NBC_01260 TaxID=2903801 RepID=UPI002E2F4E8F|nr:hypothetical protein [Streptomyces sp. NBC_01260]